jgi:hypothetical protein
VRFQRPQLSDSKLACTSGAKLIHLSVQCSQLPLPLGLPTAAQRLLLPTGQRSAMPSGVHGLELACDRHVPPRHRSVVLVYKILRMFQTPRFNGLRVAKKQPGRLVGRLPQPLI